MFLNSTNIMFLSTLNLSILLSLSSNSMFIIWMMIEVSNLSFIPIMMSKKTKNSESIMKYFIIQSISSMIIMFSLIMNMMNSNINMYSMILMSLIMKMGGVPFHNWVISIIEGMEYTPMLMLMTIMKMPPMMMFSLMNTKVMEMIMLSMLIAPLLMINQNSIKKMMCFSSIFNLSMMLFIGFEMKMWTTFMLIYTIIMMMIFKQMKMNKVKYINQMMINSNKMNKKEMWISMLSLGGMPPLTGFFNKMIVMKMMLNKKEMILMITLIISSTMILYMYMTYMYSCLMFYLSMNKNFMKMVPMKKTPSFMFNLILMPMFMLNKLFN